MPGNWKSTQQLNADTGRVEWPTGPTGVVSDGFEPMFVQAWVVQGGTMVEKEDRESGPGATQTSQTSDFAQDRSTWRASELGLTTGRFQPGTAKGIALMALYNEDTNVYKYEWWYQEITLELSSSSKIS